VLNDLPILLKIIVTPGLLSIAAIVVSIGLLGGYLLLNTIWEMWKP